VATAQPEVTRQDADNVVEKLQALGESLPPSEQRVLDTLLRVFEARITEPSVQELLADFPGGPEILEDVAGFATVPEGTEDPQLITLTTTVTVTTVYASHPWIGC
jgi:hypothetical protein